MIVIAVGMSSAADQSFVDMDNKDALHAVHWPHHSAVALVLTQYYAGFLYSNLLLSDFIFLFLK